MLLKQSTARTIMVLMVSATDHITGLAGATLTIDASKAGGAFTAITPTVTDRGNGWYALALTTAHTDTLGDLALRITATGADPTDIVLTVVAFDPFDAVRMGMTALPNAAAEAAGGLYTRGTGAGQINQPANGTIQVEASVPQNPTVLNLRYGASATIRFPVAKRGSSDLALGTNWTPVAGDVRLQRAGLGLVNATNLPTHLGEGIWSLTLTAAELTTTDLRVLIADQAPKAIQDTVIDIRTMTEAVFDALYGRTVNLIGGPNVLGTLVQTFNTDTLAHAVTMPTTVAPGDLLIVAFANDGDATVTTPAGWTQIFSEAHTTAVRLSVFAKIANGTEGGTTVDFATSATEQASAAVLRIQEGTFFPALNTNGIAMSIVDTGTSTAPDPPQVSVPWQTVNTLILAVMAADGQANATAFPDGYFGETQQGANATGATVATARRMVAATAVNPPAFTIPSEEWVVRTLAIRPAEPFPPVYQAAVDVIDDNGGTTDRWIVVWLRNGEPVPEGITNPIIQVVKAADGTDLIAATAMTEIDATRTYRYDATGAARMVSGAAYMVVVTATIDGAVRTWKKPMGFHS